MRHLGLLAIFATLAAVAACGCDGPKAGTGATCVSGADCASGKCIEDASKTPSVRFCSAPCETSADCPPSLPVCDQLHINPADTSMWCLPSV